MITTKKHGARPLLVSGHLELNESLFDDTIVQKNSFLHVRGNLTGDLTIEPGSHVVIEGSVDGKVINRGGRLVINNSGLVDLIAADGPPLAETSGILKINLSAILMNWTALRRRTVAECAAVLKADAFSCGIDQIATTLAKSGCRTFFVSDLAEARRVRTAARDAAIYVLNGLYPGTGPAFAEINAQPVISSLVDISEWDVFVASSQWNGGFALNIDTGTSRFGISVEEAVALAARVHSANLGVTLLISTLESAATADPALQARQIKLFQDVRRVYGRIPGSLANPSESFLGQEAHFDLVQLGAALFGINPTPGTKNPMHQVIELQARIVMVQNLESRQTAYSYAGTKKRPTRVALVSLGYADGYPRPGVAFDVSRQAVVGGKLCPLAGGPSMDLLAVDISELPDPTAARRGDMVTLLGAEISADDLAVAANSTGREVLANLGRGFRRIYYIG
jgi:alanine racemase